MAEQPKSEREKKLREVNVGLANNSFGAAMGAAATAPAAALAVRNANSMRRGGGKVEAGQGPVGRFKEKVKAKARESARRNPRTARALKHGMWAAPAAIAAGQAFNGGADAMTANYFWRERKRLMNSDDDGVKKNDAGISRGVDLTEVYKAKRREDWPNQSARRAYEAGLASAAGLGLAGTSAGYGAYRLANAELPKNASGKKLRQLYSRKGMARGLAQAGATGLGVAGGLSLHRRARRAAESENVQWY